MNSLRISFEPNQQADDQPNPDARLELIFDKEIPCNYVLAVENKYRMMFTPSTNVGSVDGVIDVLFADVETVAMNLANTLKMSNVAIVCGRRQVYPRRTQPNIVGESTMLFQQFGLGRMTTIVATSTNDSTTSARIYEWTNDVNGRRVTIAHILQFTPSTSAALKKHCCVTNTATNNARVPIAKRKTITKSVSANSRTVVPVGCQVDADLVKHDSLSSVDHLIPQTVSESAMACIRVESIPDISNDFENVWSQSNFDPFADATTLTTHFLPVDEYVDNDFQTMKAFSKPRDKACRSVTFEALGKEEALSKSNHLLPENKDSCTTTHTSVKVEEKSPIIKVVQSTGTKAASPRPQPTTRLSRNTTRPPLKIVDKHPAASKSGVQTTSTVKTNRSLTQPTVSVANKSATRAKDTIDCLILSNMSKGGDIEALKCILNIITPLHIVVMTISSDPNVFQSFTQMLATVVGVERTKVSIIVNDHADVFREVVRKFEAKLNILLV